MADLSTKFASKSQEWSTPDSLFQPLHEEFGFDLDVCATTENSKCARYFTLEQDALKQEWKGTCWMNPPFSQLGKWIKKAYESALAGATVVCLVPVRSNTEWFYTYCLKGEIRFIRGRPKFGNATHGLPQPLAIVVFRPPNIDLDSGGGLPLFSAIRMESSK